MRLKGGILGSPLITVENERILLPTIELKNQPMADLVWEDSQRGAVEHGRNRIFNFLFHFERFWRVLSHSWSRLLHFVLGFERFSQSVRHERSKTCVSKDGFWARLSSLLKMSEFYFLTCDIEIKDLVPWGNCAIFRHFLRFLKLFWTFLRIFAIFKKF